MSSFSRVFALAHRLCFRPAKRQAKKTLSSVEQKQQTGEGKMKDRRAMLLNGVVEVQNLFLGKQAIGGPHCGIIAQYLGLPPNFQGANARFQQPMICYDLVVMSMVEGRLWTKEYAKSVYQRANQVRWRRIAATTLAHFEWTIQRRSRHSS